VFLSHCTSTVFILFQFILFLLHSSCGTQLFSARGAILLSIELAPCLEDEDDNLPVSHFAQHKKRQLDVARNDSLLCHYSDAEGGLYIVTPTRRGWQSETS